MLRTGEHGSTFGDDPLSAAVGPAVVDLPATGEFQRRASALGSHQPRFEQQLITTRALSLVRRKPGAHPRNQPRPAACLAIRAGSGWGKCTRSYRRIRCGGGETGSGGCGLERRETRAPKRLSLWWGRSSPWGRGRGGPAAGGRRRGSR
ncbi:hypothetical protein CP972_26690 [Streptomyces prasinus]|uniref:Uncharacterized protein n=1 Tax=Streptomyces prasinus TaxID=67345 RepID=A0ABX6B8E6_9ACTN|nr:hypothetical protein CP972_26690 [Streptomyces prasinus]